MRKPELKDFKLKSFKINSGNAIEVIYNHSFAAGNASHSAEVKIVQTLPVHDDLFDILKSQKPNILKIEEINYRVMADTLKQMGVNNMDEISQVVEGMTQTTLSKIQITGFKLSGQDDKKNVVITYKKINGDKKISGRATTPIMLARNVFGFEQDLEEDIKSLKSEVYDYLFNGKHSDSDQLELGLFGKSEEKAKEEKTEEPAQAEQKEKPEIKKSSKKPVKK